MLFSNDDIVDRIARQMAIKNLTVNGLAEETGISSSSLSRYLLKRYKFPLEHITPMAKALGVSEEYLLGLTKTLAHADTVKIPVIGNIACGVPILAEENVSEYIAVPKDCISNDPNEYFFLIADGLSMAPTVQPGSKVLIHQQDIVDKNEIAAVLLLDSNEATLKRVRKSGDSVILMPDNLDFSPIVVSQDTRIRILGKAVQVITEL
ncbi:putative Xre family DNA-binding protein [Ligilactobacillus ruminis]|uniref:LexA family protein n=1 Tax=Ligilactobacillus ruminis TaxID=1623 RepID=UPI0006578AB5|nr:S24 family peptidase [Ligilactobacillus ruminis]KLA45223.1 putative Xre family DNA-binding protein [Ligilactobacillus ruminis]